MLVSECEVLSLSEKKNWASRCNPIYIRQSPGRRDQDGGVDDISWRTTQNMPSSDVEEHHYKRRAARGCMRYDQRSSGLRQCPCPCEESLLVSACLKDIPTVDAINSMIQTFRVCCLKFNWFHFVRQEWMGAGKSLAYVSKSVAQMSTLW